MEGAGEAPLGQGCYKTLYEWEKLAAPSCPLSGLSLCFSSVASIMFIITCLASVCFSGLCVLILVWPCSWLGPQLRAACLGCNKCLLGKQTDRRPVG